MTSRPSRGTLKTHMTCPICHTDNILNVVSVPDYEYGVISAVNYVECKGCGSLYQQDMPSEHVLKSYYPSNYHSFNAAGLLTKIRHALRARTFKSLLVANSTVLDFGCGSGQFIRAVAEQYPQTTFIGFEFEETNSIDINHNVTIIKGSLDYLLAQIPSVDVLLMNHVIEHLPDPIHTLEILRTKLRSNGHFIGQTPRAGSLEHRVFGTAWSGFHSPRHTVIFSTNGLKIALEKSGFYNVKTIRAFNPAALAVSLASFLFPTKRKINRAGKNWIVYLLGACFFAPLDWIFGPSGIMDFKAQVR